MVIEEIYDLEEFKELVKGRIHHKMYHQTLRVHEGFGLPMEVEAGIEFTGVAKEGHVVKCIQFKRLKFSTSDLIRKSNQEIKKEVSEFIEKTWSEFEEIAKKLNSTLGEWKPAKLE